MIDIETVYLFENASNSWIPSNSLSFPNRAMNFGDGLFESMVFENGKIRFSEMHLKRLLKGMGILGLKMEGISMEEIERLLTRDLPTGKFRVRWNVFREGSGVYTPGSTGICQTLHVKEFCPSPVIKQTAYISNTIKVYPNIWSNAKTLNALTYVLANKERLELEMDEVILLEHRGFISEAGSSNIFWKTGEDVFTPALSSSCIAGVGRAVIIDHLKEKGVEVHQGLYLPEHIFKASAVWVSNAMGISYLGSVNQKEYSTETLPFLEKVFD
ncbi:branched-chain amino acid aminotransferase [Algoriphagus iocasae]|uniref:branched-chain-amino-acid transaminase n=1 Tax=Algoriphagus iocasae TaxID=1836499 RepID=A0A841MSU1_9BACT|nr:aminotransferase class IV [Algoriphagus iocasae]MBB6325688.1 branched-chain amino acid aminotransferase [Algoriphagus iocasae]